MRLGTCVTNPATRDITVTASALATLNEITGGRMDLGIGRGDSARRVMGKKPTTVAYLEECCRVVRALTAGEKIELDGTEIQMPWVTHGPVPIWVAGYGPMALAAAGRVADGIILQLADPDIIRWCMGFVRAAAEEAGRDPDAIEVMAAAPGIRVRRPWRRPATRSDGSRRWSATTSSTSSTSTRRTSCRRSSGATSRSARATTTSTTPRSAATTRASCPTRSPMQFAIVGPASAHRERLEQLREAGVTQFNIYLMNGEEEDSLDLYGRDHRRVRIGPGLK